MSNENKPIEKERSFSVELKSKANLKNITLNNDVQENAVIEGTIGKLEHAGFVEDMVLEVMGRKGILRIDISENEIKRKGANAQDNSTQKEVN
ncbi:MAG TPA: hypothetical protein VJY36_02450 [Candidatus Bathyarchaeia archaeon]|jgi:hypothetical protein|nr:hypothetical protein [Candidatus Bathyarchaeia archaeon]